MLGKVACGRPLARQALQARGMASKKSSKSSMALAFDSKKGNMLAPPEIQEWLRRVTKLKPAHPRAPLEGAELEEARETAKAYQRGLCKRDLRFRRECQRRSALVKGAHDALPSDELRELCMKQMERPVPIYQMIPYWTPPDKY